MLLPRLLAAMTCAQHSLQSCLHPHLDVRHPGCRALAATSPLLPGLLAASCNLLRLLSLLSLLQLLLHPCESLTPVGQQLQLAPLLIHRLHVEDP